MATITFGDDHCEYLFAYALYFLRKRIAQARNFGDAKTADRLKARAKQLQETYYRIIEENWNRSQRFPFRTF